MKYSDILKMYPINNTKIIKKMKLKLNKQELKYLTIIVEKNLEKNNSFMNMNNEDFMNMLHDLYSKLTIMED